MGKYWNNVQGQERWAEIHRWLNFLTPVNVLAEVGCHDTPPIYWGWAETRICVDRRAFPAVPRGKERAIEIREDWLTATLPVDEVDLLLCFQTIEHQKDDVVMQFTAKLLASARMVMISVPYKWDRKLTKTHYQDPIDKEKLRRLMHGVRPIKDVVVDSRILALYKGWLP